MPLSFDEILNLVKAGSTEPLPAGRIDRRLEAPRSADDPDDYVNVGLNGVVASTSKLLAVNRGVADEDVRDSWAFKRVMEPSRMLRERIRMDADGSAKKVMRGLARKRSLDAFTPYQFDGYATGLFLGNPLASPLEEINPMHIIEQQRRITLMGPGGIGSPDAITPSMQCHSDDTEVLTYTGWKYWPQVTPEDRLACRVDGELCFHFPSALHAGPYKGPMHQMVSGSVQYSVTPQHRFWSASSVRTAVSRWKWETAAEQVGKDRCHVCFAAPYRGTDARVQFDLPKADRIPNGARHRHHDPLDMGDWCEYLGWWFAEGSTYDGGTTNQYTVTITQDPLVNPAKCARIKWLLAQLGFCRSSTNEKNLRVSSKDLYHYLQPFGKCTEKRLPAFLFEVRPEYRRRFLVAFLAGDGWTQKSGSGVYSTSCAGLADDLERMLLLTGSPVTRGTPWRAKKRDGTPASWMHRVNELTRKFCRTKPKHQRVVDYDGMVYCATVPGSFLLTRLGRTSKPVWTGNSIHGSQFGYISVLEGPESERAGVDSRLAWGVRIGSDGRLYQQMRNRRTGKTEWVSPEQLVDKVLKIPD